MDPRVVDTMQTAVGMVQMLLGSDVIPAFVTLLGQHYQLTDEQRAELLAGHDTLLAKQRKLRGRRAEIAAEPK